MKITLWESVITNRAWKTLIQEIVIDAWEIYYMRKVNHCGKIMLRNDQHPLRMQNHYLKPLPKLLIWAIYGSSMKHSLDNTWIWHSLGNTWIWYGFCFPYQTHTWHCLHSATSLVSYQYHMISEPSLWAYYSTVQM